jgi:DNA-binding PadR family transcriptional regulator
VSPRPYRSNPLALAALSVLSEKPMHPYEISATMRSRGLDASIRLNYGSLYSVVDGLARRGLIEPQETEREGKRPERTVYAITDAGRAEVTDWLSELLGTTTKEYPRFEAGLALMGVLPPDRVVALLRQRIDQLEGNALELEAIVNAVVGNGVARLFLVEMEYERALVLADLAFTAELADQIAAGSIDGIDEWRAFHTPRRSELRPDSGRKDGETVSFEHAEAREADKKKGGAT